jgi:hypothetical protein
MCWLCWQTTPAGLKLKMGAQDAVTKTSFPFSDLTRDITPPSTRVILPSTFILPSTRNAALPTLGG